MDMSNVRKNKTAITDKWRHTTVKRILTNPIYIGKCVQNKTRKISYKSKRIIALSEDEYTITENHHEPIIDEITFNSVQKIFENHSNLKRGTDDPLLKSLLYCSHCHNKLYIVKKQDKYKDNVTIRRYVKCATASRKISNKTCYNQYINYKVLEQQVLDKISEVLEQYLNSTAFNDKKAIEKLVENSNTFAKLEKQDEQIKIEIDILSKKLKTLYSDRLNGIIEEQDYIEFSNSLVAQRKTLETTEKEIENEMKDFDIVEKNEMMRNEMKNLFRKVLNNKDYTKEILQQLVNKIEIDKDKNVFIHFAFKELNYCGGYINAE